MTKGGCVYILTNKDNSVLYTGVTSNLQKRIWQHKTHFFQNFLRQSIILLNWFITIISAP
jgi:putative endonuclease